MTMIEDVIAMPDQIRDALWRIDSAGLEAVEVEGLIVSGIGGSAVGGDLARNLIGDRLEGPLEVIRGEHLPPWVGPKMAVLSSSYSGNTAETVAAFREAGTRGMPRWVVTTGGELGDEARAAGVGVVGLPGFLAPRASVAYTTCAAVYAAYLAGVSPDLRGELEDTASDLAAVTEALGNQAGEVAGRIGPAPVVVFAAGRQFPVARRWANQLNENAKRVAFASEMPEAAHNAIEAWVTGSNGFVSVFLVDPGMPASDRRRMDVLAEMLAESGIEAIEVDPGGGTSSSRLFRAVMLGDLVSLAVAAEAGVDPEPVPSIDEFKRRTGSTG